MRLPAAFQPWLEQPSRSGVFTDFDGTLAPIVDDPATARPLEGVPGVLAELAEGVGRVAVVSGRPARFLLHHLGGAHLSVWGLYGLEHAEHDRIVPVPEAEEWRPVVADVAQQARDDLSGPIRVEDKGVTVVLHYRRAPDHAAIAERWARDAAQRTGLALHPGRMSFELQPPLGQSKGAVVERLAAGLDAVCFFGDDHGDLEAFRALDRLGDRGVATIRVGVQTEESPEELAQRADLTVDGPEGVLEILTALRDRLRP